MFMSSMNHKGVIGHSGELLHAVPHKFIHKTHPWMSSLEGLVGSKPTVLGNTQKTTLPCESGKTCCQLCGTPP